MSTSHVAVLLLALLSTSFVSAVVGLQPQHVASGARNGASFVTPSSLPVVMWHGMGDSAEASWSMGAIKNLIVEKLGVYVHSISTGKGAVSDVWSSYFGSVNEQVAQVCAELRAIPELEGGFSAIGFSQGGQFMRAVVERCQHLGPRAKVLITLGAQHQGVVNVPGCDTVPGNLTAQTGVKTGAANEILAGAVNRASACQTMQTMLGRGAYLPWVRDNIVQAQYFKDAGRMDEYLKLNPFLPDINNEVEENRNPQYAQNLASLEQLVLFRFANDTTVVPRDSSWFSTYVGKDLIPLKDQDLYKEDYLGLKQLDEAGKLRLLEAPHAHMQFTLGWFESEVMWPFLAAKEQTQVA